MVKAKAKAKPVTSRKRKAVQPKQRDSRATEAEMQMEDATARLRTLQAKRLLVEQEIASHTGILGSGFFKKHDPKAQAALLEIKEQMRVQRSNYNEASAILESLLSE